MDFFFVRFSLACVLEIGSWTGGRFGGANILRKNGNFRPKKTTHFGRCDFNRVKIKWLVKKRECDWFFVGAPASMFAATT